MDLESAFERLHSLKQEEQQWKQVYTELRQRVLEVKEKVTGWGPGPGLCATFASPSHDPVASARPGRSQSDTPQQRGRTFPPAPGPAWPGGCQAVCPVVKGMLEPDFLDSKHSLSFWFRCR